MNNVSTNLTHGFKTALAAVLAYYITTILALDFGYWAVITAVIVMQVYVADSVEMCFYRLSGTLIGAAMGVVVLLVIPKTAFFTGAALFVTVGICSFLTRFNTRYRMAGITVVIVVMTGICVQDVFIFGLYRVLEICIGILCAFLVSVLVLPKRKVDTLRAALERQAKACAERCLILVDAFVSRQQNVEESPVAELVKDVWKNHELLQKASRNESLIYSRKFNENFPLKVSVISRSVEHLRNMVRALNAFDDDGYDIIMAGELKKLAETSGRALVLFVKNEYSTIGDDLEKTISELDDRLGSIRKEGLVRRFDSRKLVQVFSFYSSLLYFADDILTAITSVNREP
ncbi:FUSC family protein [Breoghania sp.]|uniref:FUSC family protein n=1 Tax=Breoghania sp. TaxID=2065378 RepID=UPI0029C97156|nr:FUSC family protein [Breoghania sp.]